MTEKSKKSNAKGVKPKRPKAATTKKDKLGRAVVDVRKVGVYNAKHQMGLTYEQIAAAYGISPLTASRWCKEIEEVAADFTEEVFRNATEQRFRLLVPKAIDVFEKAMDPEKPTQEGVRVATTILKSTGVAVEKTETDNLVTFTNDELVERLIKVITRAKS